MFQRKMSLSFTRVSLLFLLFLASCNQVQSAAYRIEFDPIFSPPAIIPRIPQNMLYSAPLNQVMSKAIIVRVKDNSNKIIVPEGNPDVLVRSLDVSSLTSQTATDVWKQTGGMICQRTRFGISWPERLNRKKYTKLCGSKDDSSVLVKKFVKDMIILDWLSHEHPTGKLPDNNRFLRVSIPDMKLTADSNAFNITVPAASLFISQQPPTTITANTPFDVTAEIRDSNGKVITEGLDSILYVELTVPYEYKQFYHKFGKDMLVAVSHVRLGGSTVIHQATYDTVMRKQASNGRVYFTNIRILDIIQSIRLNLTMYMSKDPWLRSPDCPTCYADINEKRIDSYGMVQFKPMTPAILSKTPAVSLTNEFDVIQQLLDNMVIHSPFKQTEHISITRNFQIPGPMYLEARDVNRNRIYSGPHANLPLEIVTYPKGVCISTDHTTYIRQGYGRLSGSVCQIISSVYMSIYSRLNVRAVANSTHFNVVGDVHLAHFDHFKYSGAGLYIQPHVNSFVRLGAQDINSGAIPGVLKHFQMKIIVDTVETQNDVARTNNIYADFRVLSHHEPSKTLRGIILPKNRKMAVAIIRDANNDGITMISIAQKAQEFKAYRFFNRICWNWNQIIISFLIAAKERGWSRIGILRMENELMPEALHEFSAKLNISFDEDVDIPLFDPIKPDKAMLADKLKDLVNLKTRIVIALINSTYQVPLLSSAHEEGLSSQHGFQWIFLSDYARQFPFNEMCGSNITCSEAFKGSLMFTETYNISHFHSTHWHRVLAEFLAADRTMFMGMSTYYPDNDAGALMGLGYDAVWLFSEAINRIISRQHTASGWLITQELRKLTINGLSGVLKLDNLGDRSAYLGTIKVVNTEPENRAQLIRFVKRVDNDVQIELKFGIVPKIIDPITKMSLTKIPLPTSQIYNLRSFLSYSGGIDEENYILKFDKSEVWPSIKFQRFEKIVPQYLCKDLCGKRVSIKNVNLYDRGKCVSMNTCECFLGYYGNRCERIMCVCLFGRCFVPFKCVCAKGWSGKTCSIPICSFPCSNGKCTEPETCKCSSSVWINSTCSIHIATIIVPLILILAALVYLAYVGSFWLRKYLERKAALSDLSWLVKWTDVTMGDVTTTSTMSAAIELCTWNREKWHVKNFNSKSIDVDDAKVRFDMVELVTLNHNNLISYGGACLTYPNVCLLLEPALKGSLEDILVNESIQLGWDFRFSFMRDICNGMNFLHTKTDFNSHGRLKSSNCLLDNRWSIRLSGFGAPTIRYGPYSIWVNEEDPDIYNENQISLLWTAPELLETVSCLDDVRMGTKEGDIYSFGIIVTEIATRNVPFGHERNFLSIFSILDLIVDKDNPNLASEREVWSSIGGDLFCIRPQLTSEQMPDGNAAKKKFKKMLDDVWCEQPTARLPFQKLVSILNNIYPSKGELMDNLINLLESYSSNLEHVVVERTNDLEIEKVKIDNIIGQMLPKQVVESLKNGEKVQPETFDNVTVFYSDIVGFTTIARKSKPMQVVDLLNHLYGKFDGILAQYDVYKVETIGDAYVVSSGVPNRNGNLHAGEIATASIDIVCTIMTVPIPHLPDDKLLLRMGIHSGSVVAGVVGLKMPRYTLFGETMQIAATLEATSKPLRVQVSKYTINILNELGGYFYKRRGDRDVCGRSITTYWLIGKAGYEKVLPDVDD